MTTFLFVRHAVTSHTGQRLSGWLPGVHLSEQGRQQAEVVADALAQVKIKAFYASPIERTMETAAAIAARHGAAVESCEDLGEVRYGRWTNRSFKTLRRTRLWTALQQCPSLVRFPEGETLREVQSRATEVVERLRLQHPRDIVCCVSHADVIRLIAAHYLGVHIDLFQRITIGPASITAIHVTDGGPLVLSMNAPSLGGMAIS